MTLTRRTLFMGIGVVAVFLVFLYVLTVVAVFAGAPHTTMGPLVTPS